MVARVAFEALDAAALVDKREAGALVTDEEEAWEKANECLVGTFFLVTYGLSAVFCLPRRMGALPLATDG